MGRAVLFEPIPAALAGAQPSRPMLGTKPDAPPRLEPAPAGAGVDWVQPLVLCALILVAVKWAARLLRKGAGLARGASSGLTVVASVPFGPGALSVVAVEGRRLLVGSSPSSISLIADLTPAAGSKPEPEAPAFFELLDEARAVVADSAEPPADREALGGSPAGGSAAGPEGGMSMDEALALLREARTRIGADPRPDPETGHVNERLERLLKG